MSARAPLRGAAIRLRQRSGRVQWRVSWRSSRARRTGPIMITCACGARFEVDDTLAGQEVLCPDCQQPLKAPAVDRPPQLTSGWALASVVLALVGAFTLFGSLAAVLLGVIALISISRHRRQVSGTGFAVFGICLGVLFTGLT